MRSKLALSYTAFLMVAGTLLLATVWVFLLRYVPEAFLTTDTSSGPPGPFTPSRTDLLDAFAPRAGQTLLVLLVVGLIGGWILAGRMLAPLSKITDATRLAAEGSLSHRIRLDGRRDELRELADSFDAMLARIEAQVGEQERFAANASHELRTPLTITQALLEVAAQDPAHDHRMLIDHLQLVNRRAIDLTQAMLILSRAHNRAFSVAPVDLSLCAEEAAETLHPLAEERNIFIKITGHAPLLLGSPELLQQLTTNLVQNAILHNLAEGGVVRIATSAAPGRVVLTVENTGPHLSPQTVATLTEPFYRGNGRTHTDRSGTGLGLAIVHSITVAHHGNLTLTARAEGGLIATVQIPSAPPPTV